MKMVFLISGTKMIILASTIITVVVYWIYQVMTVSCTLHIVDKASGMDETKVAPLK